MGATNEPKDSAVRTDGAPQAMVAPPAYYADDEIDLRELFGVLWQGKWLIVACTVIATVLGVTYALLATPQYQIDTLLAPADHSQDGAGAGLAARFGGLASLAGVSLPGGGSSVDEAIALLKSRAFVDGFIQEHQLIPEIFHKLWDRDAGRWKLEGEDAEPPSIRDAYKAWTQNIMSVSQDKKTGLVTVSLLWHDRHQAVDWLTRIVAKLNEVMRAQAVAEAEQNKLYLEQELGKTSVVEVQKAIFGLIEQQVTSIMLANTRAEYAFRTIDPPVVPDKEDKAKPKRKLIVIMAFLLGGFIGVLAVFIRRMMRPDDGATQQARPA